jgi:hypothetical protein
MDSRPILQIVSGFKPSIDGMGDFSRLLGKALWEQHQLPNDFLVYRRPSTSLDPQEIAPNRVFYPQEASADSLRQILNSLLAEQSHDFALVHYGPYAYSPKGNPAPFAAAMQELAGRMPVLVFFHEMFSKGMPWRRAFWTQPEQKRTIASLLTLSTASFTSNEGFRKRLEVFNAGHRPLTTIPIFSNIGEPHDLPPLDRRARQLVIFGQGHTRDRLYKEHLPVLEGICRMLRIANVVDVGAGQSSHLPSKIGDSPVRSVGRMEERELSALMADSVAGVLGYWSDVWEKSGVMAAYLAHGLLPILVELEPRSMPRQPVVPYLLPEELPAVICEQGSLSDLKLQDAATAAHQYYLQRQSVHHCAQVIASFSTQSRP